MFVWLDLDARKSNGAISKFRDGATHAGRDKEMVWELDWRVRLFSDHVAAFSYHHRDMLFRWDNGFDGHFRHLSQIQEHRKRDHLTRYIAAAISKARQGSILWEKNAAQSTQLPSRLATLSTPFESFKNFYWYKLFQLIPIVFILLSAPLICR